MYRDVEACRRAATVARALRLIGEGYLDRHRVRDLARRVYLSERQLRRLFTEHLGAAPLAVARVRRAQVARMLIDQTDLTMAAVAHAAGYSSIRRFNEDVRRSFGRPPTELRRVRTRSPGAGLALRLPYRPPLAWRELLAYLALRATPGVEAVAGTAYRRTARLGELPCVIELEDDPARSQLLLRLTTAGVDGIVTVAECARRLADLDADPQRIDGLLGADPLLAGLVARRPGLRVPGAWEPFELAVRAVLGQQVTVRGASTLAGRLAAAFGEPLEAPDGTLTHCFPAPAELAEADVAAVGLPRARAESIRGLARAVRDRSLSLDPAADLAETLAGLEALPGIGPWTAQYVAMRALRDPDALPASDLGLRHALALNGRPATAAEVAVRSEAWRPWRAYAAMHLWLAGAEPLRGAA